MSKYINRCCEFLIQIIIYCLILAKMDDILLLAMDTKWHYIFKWGSSLWIDALMAIYVIFVLYVLGCIIIRNYHINFSIWLFVGFLTILWRELHSCSYSYVFTPLKSLPSLSWADVVICGLWTLLGVYLLTISCRCVYVFFNSKVKKKRSADGDVAKELLLDSPIENKEEDKLDYQKWAVMMSDEICKLKLDKAYSYGVVGEWGVGKTSFINLLKRELECHKKKFEIVDFNPRNSSAPSHIQEDFLMTLCGKLNKYDFGLHLLASRYVKALRLDSRIDIVVTILNSFSSDNVQGLRERIGNSIKRIKRKVVVFIDDLDRLGKDEIIEVFKLIHCNASFPNTIFITAYDKKQINNILTVYQGQDENIGIYSDKYFNKELRLAFPSNRMSELFRQTVSRDAVLSRGLNKRELLDISADINKHYHDIRLLKKLVNNLAEIGLDRWDEVEHLAFVRLQIIRHKYYEDYFALMNKTILVNNESNTLKKLCHNQAGFNTVYKESKEIIEKLFSHSPDVMYKEITMACSFNNYFVELSPTIFKWTDLEPLFNTQQTKFTTVEDKISGFLTHFAYEENIRAITIYHLEKDKKALRSDYHDEAFLASFQRDVQILFCCYDKCKKIPSLQEIYASLLDAQFENIAADPLAEYSFKALANYPGQQRNVAKKYLEEKGLTGYYSIK